MAATYIIRFPDSMDGRIRLDIEKKFYECSWETFPCLDPVKCIYSYIEVFWSDDSEPYFPEIPKDCIISKK